MKTTIKPLLVTLLLLSSSFIFATDPLSDPGTDPGIAPINDCIVPMLALGIALGFFLIKKKKTA